MASNEIDIAKHLEKFEKILNNTGVPTLAIISCVSDIIMEIRLSLMSQENIAIKDNQTPILECNSAEIQIWAIAILASVWTTWCFTSRQIFLTIKTILISLKLQRTSRLLFHI
jgi:hypothetical protein